jgi:membrane peptidoglycan carboxypeptidase
VAPRRKPRSCLAEGLRLGLRRALIVVLITGAALAFWEGYSSENQATILAQYSEGLSYRIEAGATETPWYPKAGPYDQRLGYSELPAFIERLSAREFVIDAQARFSPAMLTLVEHGLSPPYREKPQAGLRVLDRSGTLLSASPYPAQIYRSFDDIPSLIVSSLLFIEDRKLLDDRYPTRNPAIDWPRLARAAVDYALRPIRGETRGPGGSTLATQLEKSRHSAHGVTLTVEDKIRQMASASLKSYLDGADTSTYRRRLIADYLNALPLAARHGHGEVIGLASGLEQWFGADFETANAVLAACDKRGTFTLCARAYKQVLSLLIAQRRPTTFLVEDPEALFRRTDSYLRVLAKEEIIPPDLAHHAIGIKLAFRSDAPQPPQPSAWRDEAANVVRPYLVSTLGLPGLYELDRLDLTVHTTIDASAQEVTAAHLAALADPDYVESAGLDRKRLLDRGDPSGVHYSVSIYERGETSDRLRVQVDNRSGPLSMNEGTKLDLGSTAKLRTLVTYLSAVATLHNRLAPLPRETLQALPARDPLTRWAAATLLDNPGLSLRALLDAAMARRYSASPTQRFFTGGGIHTFRNFDKKNNGRVFTVRDAFKKSINLVFIRLMRDVVRFYEGELPGMPAAMLDNVNDPRRAPYLERFAKREGRTFISRFFNAYAGKTPDEILARIMERTRRTKAGLAATLRYIDPTMSFEAFSDAINARIGSTPLPRKVATSLFEKYETGAFDLQDRGAIVRLHPLELWVARTLIVNPTASRGVVLSASGPASVEAYRWLIHSRSERKQNNRLKVLLEADAFGLIHRQWQRLGYPFDYLVPSYASALGSSGDRPAALARLMGIILGDGIARPAHRVSKLHLAEATPYDVAFSPAPSAGERVIPAEVAAVVRDALVATATSGTARRIGQVENPNGAPIIVGGKTGTGDHRKRFFDSRARQTSEQVVNRTATFAFFVGDRFYGVITAHVAGPDAANYGFTSGLPVEIFKLLQPTLLTMIDQPGTPAQSLSADAEEAAPLGDDSPS